MNAYRKAVDEYADAVEDYIRAVRERDPLAYQRERKMQEKLTELRLIMKEQEQK